MPQLLFAACVPFLSFFGPELASTMLSGCSSPTGQKPVCSDEHPFWNIGTLSPNGLSIRSANSILGVQWLTKKNVPFSARVAGQMVGSVGC